MYLLDTNIFLELLLNREKAGECEKLLLKLQDGSIKAVCSRFAIHSICVYAVNNGLRKECGEFLRKIFSMDNLILVDTSNEDCLKIIRSADEKKLDFDDALQYHLAKETDCEAIITFDSDFMGKGIRSIEPKEALAIETKNGEE